MKRHKERHKIGSVSLIHLEEYFVEVFDHRAELVVTEVESLGAKVVCEYVGAGVKYQRFCGNVGTIGAEIIDQTLNLLSDYRVQLIVLVGESPRECVRPESLSSRLLNL